MQCVIAYDQADALKRRDGIASFAAPSVRKLF
eukprot:SAG11_NODE_10473_length_829_cov_0.961644_2_plen_31_part_01